MSNHSGVENNASRLANDTSDYLDTYRHFYIASITVDTTFSVAGTLINVWFLAALLLSPEIRSRIRNRIICGMLVVHLTEAMILCPLSVIRVTTILLKRYESLDCYFETVHNSIYHIQDFVGNWYLLTLLCIYTAQVMNFEPKFTPLWKNILNVLLFMSPCIFALLVVPIVMKSYYARYSDDRCLVTTFESIKVYKSLDTVVPQTLATLLLAVTAVLKYRRYYQRRSFDTLNAQLIDDGSQTDPWYPFVALFITAVASDFCLTVACMNPMLFIGQGIQIWLNLYISFGVLAYSRLIFVPVMLLLFRDIRERIKIWRPCRRSALLADLVVTYEKNTS
ncbi:hypothetical protein BsWGS_03730 [Bradybaena similaris]